MTNLTSLNTDSTLTSISHFPEGSSPITCITPDIIAKIGLFLTPTENIRLLGTCTVIRSSKLLIERDFRISYRAEVHQFFAYAGPSVALTQKERSDIDRLMNDWTLQNTKQIKHFIKKILIGSLGNLEQMALIKSVISRFPSNHLKTLFDDILQVITKIQGVAPEKKDSDLYDFCKELVNQKRFDEACLVANQMIDEKKRTSIFNDILYPLVAQQKFNEAISIIQKINDPTLQSHAFLEMVDNFKECGKYDEAILLVDIIFDKWSTRSKSFQRIARKLIVHQKFDKAIEVSERARPTCPDSADDILHEVVIALVDDQSRDEKQRFDKAISVANKIQHNATRERSLQYISKHKTPSVLKSALRSLKGIFLDNRQS